MFGWLIFINFPRLTPTRILLPFLLLIVVIIVIDYCYYCVSRRIRGGCFMMMLTNLLQMRISNTINNDRIAVMRWGLLVWSSFTRVGCLCLLTSNCIIDTRLLIIICILDTRYILFLSSSKINDIEMGYSNRRSRWGLLIMMTEIMVIMIIIVVVVCCCRWSSASRQSRWWYWDESTQSMRVDGNVNNDNDDDDNGRRCLLMKVVWWCF